MTLSPILIADSGSTKAAWLLTDGTEIRTSGINALQTPDERLSAIVADELLPAIPQPEQVAAIHFYGAGVISDVERRRITDALRPAFPKAEIAVESDLLAAARALCGHRPGIACILGTGSNSCLYDGCRITANVPPLGYILGDEGSGAVLGKLFIADLLRGLLGDDLRREFYTEYAIDYPELIRRIYRAPGANVFLASTAPFILRNIHLPEVEALVIRAFTAFFERNVALYHDYRDLPVGFVGSIACHFRPQLEKAAQSLGIALGRILSDPARALLDFHTGG